MAQEVPIKNEVQPTSKAASQHKTTSVAPSLADNMGTPKRTQSAGLDEYFYGPRDLDRHSKWPLFMRLHGSILPEMILPLLLVAAWATAIRLASHFGPKRLDVDSVLLTVLGFVVALGLSFRSSTAYERYSEGRKYWAQLSLVSHTMARVIWIHGIEKAGEEGREDVLRKKSGLNLVVALCVSLKHKVRHEPWTSYDDISGYLTHLDTFAGTATKKQNPQKPKVHPIKEFGQLLGLSFAESNPMKEIKKSQEPLGNLPLEILSYLAAFVDDMVDNGQLKVAMHQTTAYNTLTAFNDVITGCDRIVRTPLAIAYKIAISQITWVYILCLPFQLEKKLTWVMIPACVVAAYIILGILLIGQEIENPFGHDVNDLPLDAYCDQIATDIDVISSRAKPDIRAIMASSENRVMFPLSQAGYTQYAQGNEASIRKDLKYKAEFETRPHENAPTQNGGNPGATQASFAEA